MQFTDRSFVEPEEVDEVIQLGADTNLQSKQLGFSQKQKALNTNRLSVSKQIFSGVLLDYYTL
jgi:hypothetical protein